MSDLAYAQFKRNEFSQFGEDGIIEHIFKKIPALDMWCVEFGAWDGIHLSNTFNLIKNRGYRSVLIEANKKKFRELQKNLWSFDTVLVNEFVTCDGDGRLDNILSHTAIPKNFDFLSIDIDGNDYWILDSLYQYQPKVICIEYNPSIPNEVEYIQQLDFSLNRGASALSICKLAKLKSYELLATTHCNLIFIDRDYFHLFEIEDNRLTTLRDDSDVRIYVFSGFDGTIMYSSPIDLMWHNIKVGSTELQILPKVLRKFPSEYNFCNLLLFFVICFRRTPRVTILKLLAVLRSKISKKSD